MKKANNHRKTVEVGGLNLLGEERQYGFKLMSVIQGMEMLHSHMFPILQYCQQVQEYIDSEDDGDLPVMTMTCRGCFEPKVFSELREALLDGYKSDSLLEIYAALYHALLANFKKDLDPLLKALAEQGKKDSSPIPPDKTQSPATSDTP